MALTAVLAERIGGLADPAVFVRGEGDERRLELLVQGARCAACLAKIEKGVGGLKGVRQARMNLTTGKLVVAWRGAAVRPVEIVETLERLGYPSVPFDPADAVAGEDMEGRRLAIALGVAGFGAANAMMFSVPVWAGLFHAEMGVGVRTLFYWLTALIAGPCALFAGMTFFKSAWASLRKGRANMDVPISIGVLLAIGVSIYETSVHGRHAYFDAAVSLLFLLLIGRYLDHKLRANARSAARALLAMQATSATRLAPDGAAVSIALRDVVVGDRLEVLPGDRMPVDAVVEAGSSLLDVSLLTGETAPATAGAGVAVQAGAINLTGRLIVRALARSEDSAVAAIARLMEDGAQTKSRYVRLADKAAAIYVPTVHTVAALTFVGWLIAGLAIPDALMRAAAVLIITCPCAMGLAAPAVQIVASGRLFTRNVLVKSGAALERLAEVDCVVFDKTGVLTYGRPTLIDGDAGLVARAAPLARASRHPLARALVRAAGPGPTADQAREVAGMGVEGVIDGRSARLGRASFVGAVQADEETTLWFARDGEAPERLGFNDELRADAAATVKALKARGFSVEVLSGDVEAAVSRACAEAGISRFRAALSPLDKAAVIDSLIAAGRRPPTADGGRRPQRRRRPRQGPRLHGPRRRGRSEPERRRPGVPGPGPAGGGRGDRYRPGRPRAGAGEFRLCGPLQSGRRPRRGAGPDHLPDRSAGDVGLVPGGDPERASGPARGATRMIAMIYLIPISLAMALVGLCAFLWTFKSGQYDDPKGDAERILYDHLDEGPPADL